MSLRKVLRAAGIGMLLLAQADGAELWTDDFEQAMNEAKASGRYLLLDFTGSDWCGWCKRLDAEVFKDDTFKEFAASNLVCVKVDFPMFKEQSDKLRQQNAALKQMLGVDRYPFLVLVNSSAEAFFATGYKPGGAKVFIHDFSEAIEADRARRRTPAQAPSP